MTMTEGEVVAFWRGYCERKDVAKVNEEAGVALIHDDPEFWADNEMSKLLDRAIQRTGQPTARRGEDD